MKRYDHAAPRYRPALLGGLLICFVSLPFVSGAGTLAGTLAGTSSASFDIAGSVTVTKVTDGDSLRSGKLKIRLFGIDAPEIKQNCTDADGTSWACGIAARTAVDEMVGTGAKIECHLRDVDRYGRLVMQCFHQGRDIADLLVRAGLALSYRTYSPHYIAAETAAKAAGRGMWQGSFMPPWEWRKAQ